MLDLQASQRQCVSTSRRHGTTMTRCEGASQVGGKFCICDTQPPARLSSETFTGSVAHMTSACTAYTRHHQRLIVANRGTLSLPSLREVQATDPTTCHTTFQGMHMTT
jgi:hypothetical protein